MMPLVVIRPEPGCTATLAASRAAGLEARGFPLFAVEPVAWEPVSEAIDALLLGSANALRHGGAGLAGYAGMPAWCVGETTAAAARAAGLAIAAIGKGGLQAVLDTVPAPARLLRLAGEERIVLAPPPGVSLIERVVYASRPLAMPPALADLLRQGAVVALHSAEAARHFARECDAHGVDRARLKLAAIGPRVADAAGTGWRALACADEPGDAALLALARRMCQEPAGT